MTSNRYLLALCSLCSLLSLSSQLAIAEVQAADSVAAQTALAAESTSGEVVGVELHQVSSEAIARLRKRCDIAEEGTEETRAEANEFCDKTATKLADAEKLAATTEALKKELELSSSEIEKLQQPVGLAVDIQQLPAVPSVDQLRNYLTTLGQQLSLAKEKVVKVTAEIERRAERRKVLPELLTKNREQYDSLANTLGQPLEKSVSILTEAKQLYHLARRDYLSVEYQWLEQEVLTYESNSRLWLARRDAAERELQAVVSQHQAVKEQVAEAKRQEAEKQAQSARMTAINAHPAVQSAAALNAQLADRNEKIVLRLQQLTARLTEAKELGQTMKNRLTDVTKRADAGQHSTAIGAMLRTQQDQLPALAPIRDRLGHRPVEASQLGLDVYEWESLRRECLHCDEQVEQAKQQLADESIELSDAAAKELRRIFEARTEILAELIANASDSLSRIEELDAAESEVVSTTEELSDFIAEQILWVRSAPTIGLPELQHTKDFWSNAPNRLAQVKSLGMILSRDIQRRAHWWGFGLLLATTLVVGRSRARTLLRETGEAAAKPTATKFRPTVLASLATMFMALPIPTCFGFVGWRLSRGTSALAFSTGWALMLFAAAYAMLNLARHASRQGGLGANHFGWDIKGLAAIRRAARTLELLALPLLAIAVGVEIGNDEISINSLGRLSLISSLFVIGTVCFRLFRSNGALNKAIAASAKGYWFARLVKLLGPLTTLGVFILITASIAGYHYTAMQLTRRIFVSCLFVFACFALRSLLMRWLMVAYRRVAMQHAREKRQAMLEAQENTSAETAPVEIEPQFNLADINQQARKLVGMGVGAAFVLSMWFVWGDVLPALGVFNRVELWASSLTPINPDAAPTFVTLGDLVASALILSITWFAGRNLPGLLEITVLQKLPLDAGARYAASSITRYTITVVGLALGMRQLGIGWNSVQWLVAAMTVGLGFGLQEIFANFVSGIILLFERPARVGDTVTVGEITGTVTKIRIRATTVLDWDNKELIVPNKDFVTGNLVNWTLSNPHLRLIVRVGIAYGSDTRLATKLLYQVAAENCNVLDNPEPIVIFNEFGDSSLNFELRLFVDDLIMYRRLRHDLHLDIDDLFRQHNIEIAFPQCDLHVKSLPHQAERDQSLQQHIEPESAAA